MTDYCTTGMKLKEKYDECYHFVYFGHNGALLLEQAKAAWVKHCETCQQCLEAGDE